ncbi:MAG: PdaC/SigV domain-containing protein [Spirosomataceae bacterium]
MSMSKKNQLSFWVFSAFVAFVWACQPAQKDETAGVEEGPVVWVVDSVKIHKAGTRRINNSDTTQTNVHVSFPLLKNKNVSPEVVSQINARIEQKIKDIVWGWTNFEENVKTPTKSVEALAEEFIRMAEQDLASFNEDVPTSFMSYELEVTGKVDYINEKVASITFSTYSFTGGAHPNSAVEVLNISLETGKELGLEEMITDTVALKKVVEEAFIANEKKELQEVVMSDYFFEEGFALPSSISVKPNGLYFVYSPYEAASYARGYIEFEIPFTKLGTLVNKDKLGIK